MVPTVIPPAPPPYPPSQYAYRDLVGLARLLKILLVLGIVIGVVELWADSMQLALFNQDEIFDDEVDANDLRQALIGFASFGLRLVTIVVFAIWIVRAQRNVRALGAQCLPVSPGWSVGFFFVPIPNLWKPYVAMRSLSQASQQPIDWSAVRRSAVLPLWWTLWIANSCVGYIATKMSWRAQTIEQLRNATTFSLVSTSVDMVLCLAAYALVAQITKAQTDHLYESMAGGEVVYVPTYRIG